MEETGHGIILSRALVRISELWMLLSKLLQKCESKKPFSIKILAQNKISLKIRDCKIGLPTNLWV